MIFLNYSSLINLDISGWNINQVTDMYMMFNYCPKLTEVKVSQEIYKNMIVLAKKNNKTVKDYIQLDSSIIKY